ncbi:putative Bet3 family, NO signaling/Golgi transport ligand-binding domain superfamily [Helianthus anomalus]
MAPVVPRSGDAIFANVERVNAELFTLTCGAIVRQLLTDLEEVEEVNKQLDQMYAFHIAKLFYSVSTL